MTVPAGAARAGNRAARREALLDAADAVVLRDGPAASMAALAAEAGITKPILYRHFGDKSGLYSALAERHTTRLIERVRASLGQSADRRERVRRTIETYLAAISDEPGLYRFLMHRAAAEDAGVHGQVAAFVRRVGAEVGAGIAAELRLPPEQAGLAQTWGLGIVGMVQVAGDAWLESPDVSAHQLADQLTDLVWGAYAGWA